MFEFPLWDSIVLLEFERGQVRLKNGHRRSKRNGRAKRRVPERC